MPDIFAFISKYFWLICLGFAWFNYSKAKRDFLSENPTQPTRVQDAETYLRRIAGASALPWLVMGAGQITGSTPSVWHYFRPQDSNPYVLAWLGVIFVLTCVYAWWVLFAGGASKIRELNLMAALGQHSSKPPSEFAVKAFAALGPLLFPVWIYMTVTMNAPLPP